MIPAAVGYHRATSLEDAFRALAEPDARALAGGQSLVPMLKLRVARPSLLVDIGALELGGIELAGDELRIGALATWDALASAPELETPSLVALAECAAGIGDLQVRNRGTVGGSLAHADPASDLPAVVLALGARLELRSPEGERSLAVADFFQIPYTTALGERELIVAVVVPIPPRGSGSAYASVEHPASGFALAGAAALARPDGSSTVALTGVGARATLLPEDGSLQAVEMYGDRFAPEGYKRHVAEVVVRRALERARERAEAR
jgi:aerobic carbon-monoxide dehydrogenase medium subunit